MTVKIIITVIFILILGSVSQSFIINISPSEPLGVYKIEKSNSIHRGDIVAVCLSVKYKKIGLKDGYLIPGMRCEQTAPLLKTVIAVPGDAITLKNSQIIVNGRIYPYATKQFDSKGRALDQVLRGFYKDKKYWLIGVANPNSWDSRYWGGVDKSQILYCVRRVF
jgi:conjugative transfer signal peptidase TraF